MFPALPIQVTPPAKGEFSVIRLASVTVSARQISGAFDANFAGTEITGKTVQLRATPPVTLGTNFA